METHLYKQKGDKASGINSGENGYQEYEKIRLQEGHMSHQFLLCHAVKCKVQH